MTQEKWFILSENELKKKKKSSYFIRYLRGQLDADKDILKSDVAFFFITKHNISGKFSIESVQETI